MPLEPIFAEFAADAAFASAEAFTAGHINDSYLVTTESSVGRRFLLQRINTEIFRDVAGLMDNVQRVTRHLAAKGGRGPKLILARDGGTTVADDAGGVWRMFSFVENTRTFLTIDSPRRALAAARAYGEFQRMLIDLPPPPLFETLPGFHDTPKRLEAFDAAVRRDAAGRCGEASAEIAFVADQREMADTIMALERTGESPRRVAHYDAKVSNVLFDADSDEAVCVVDFDTVMPGSVLYDFGDMVRSMACPADEDETDLSRVRIDLDLFEAVARGYLAAAGGFLTGVEKQNLITAGKVITFEQGVRFLADFLDGDIYYKTARPTQNLDRARNQFRLVESIIKSESPMNDAMQRR
ncbi:MAG: aminoglycoside phosphotransferase family protein [Planctomycetes bacterium]|nr:aminoglycoside phosphotransferase family protein [Planctomycetota bacterium]